MKKLTYSEQLRHPKWQKMRLEVLDASGFQCDCCKSTEKTLNVHHKSYVKGRMAWEYEVENFESLCEECHKFAHTQKERLDSVIAGFPSDMYATLADLLIGFGEEYVNPQFWLHADEQVSQAGRLAYHMSGNVRPGGCFEAADAFQQIGPDRFMDAVAEAVKKDFK